MPRLDLTIIIPAVDTDGVDHRARKTVDVWAELTEGQRTALTAIHARIQAAVDTRYGETAVVESALYVGDA